MFVVFKNKLSIITEIIGPTDERAINPKLVSSPFFDFLFADKPSPKAIKKGTDIEPVVTPPASYITGTNSCGTKKARMNTIK